MKTLFTIAFIFYSAIIFSQSPTVTSAIAQGLTGKTVNAHYVSAPAFDEGNAGASQTWDFSTYTFGAAAPSTYITPSTGIGYSNFTGCTDALQVSGGGTTSLSYNKLNNNIYSLIGLVQQNQQGTVAIIYDNVQDIYHFPMSLNSSFSDNFHANADYTQGATLGRGGSTSAVVDGYGTLKTPAGTFPNCLRVKITQTVSDTFYYQGQYTSDQQTNTVSYNWIAQSYPGLTLMNISTGQGPIQAIDYAFYVDVNTTGINELENGAISVAVYPNPATDVMHLTFSEPVQDATVALFDLTGRQVFAKPVNVTGETTLTTTDFAKGIYVLKLITKQGVSSQRVVIE